MEINAAGNSSFFHVMPDGERFVVRFAPAATSPPYLNVILDWFEELTGTGRTD